MIKQNIIRNPLTIGVIMLFFSGFSAYSMSPCKESAIKAYTWYLGIFSVSGASQFKIDMTNVYGYKDSLLMPSSIRNVVISQTEDEVVYIDNDITYYESTNKVVLISDLDKSVIYEDKGVPSDVSDAANLKDPRKELIMKLLEGSEVISCYDSIFDNGLHFRIVTLEPDANSTGHFIETIELTINVCDEQLKNIHLDYSEEYQLNFLTVIINEVKALSNENLYKKHMGKYLTSSGGLKNKYSDYTLVKQDR